MNTSTTETMSEMTLGSPWCNSWKKIGDMAKDRACTLQPKRETNARMVTSSHCHMIGGHALMNGQNRVLQSNLYFRDGDLVGDEPWYSRPV